MEFCNLTNKRKYSVDFISILSFYELNKLTNFTLKFKISIAQAE